MATNSKVNYIKILKLLVFLACIIILSTIGTKVFAKRFFNQQLTVIPNVVNLDQKDAIEYLEEAQLRYQIQESTSEKVPVNHVFIQVPAPEQEVKVNRVIKIWVNSGKGTTVPNLVGQELIDARAKLQNDKIQIDKIDYQPSAHKYNTIIAMYPAPGTPLGINQKISLLVSSRQIINPSVMPNIIGLDLNDAKELLEQIGLKVGGVSKSTDPNLPVNTIISTNPAPGSKITKGQTVSIVINEASAVPKNAEPTVEQIINQTNPQNIDSSNIENIIDETLQKIDEKKKQPSQNGGTPNNGSEAPAKGEGNTPPKPAQPETPPQPKQ